MLRKAALSDLDGVEEAYREHFAHEKQYGAYTVFQEGIYPTRQVAENAMQNGSLYVCEENDVILGSMILNEHQPDEYKKINWQVTAENEKVRVLHLLMVRPNASGKGVGTSLVNYAIDIAKRQFCVTIRLDTGEQNVPAISLYKKLGFQVAANIPMRVGGVIPHSHHLFFEKMI
ncbi:MAG: GNAT family N-acetyltransferase [Desulfovibrionaceae bacterium]|nr:GNAT family N-acetyltransferase [Desulfovibrionaceae bacterium]